MSTRVHGTVPVLAAVFGNFFVMILKFVAATVSGSSAMFSEAIHSVADVFNQLLLFIGIKRSTKKADRAHIYGYGRERFFWALISASSIFFLGAGVTIFHGLDSWGDKKNISSYGLIFSVLILSFIVEAFTFYLAGKEIWSHRKGKESFKKALKHADPSTLAVFYEDGIALLGVLAAFSGIFLSKLFQVNYFDSLASIVVGFLLGAMAIILAFKNRQFLLGRSIDKVVEEKIIETLEADPAIERVMDFKSVILDVDVYRIKCEVEFNGNFLLKEMIRRNSLQEEYEDIKDDYEEFKKFCFEFADRIPRIMGNKIDEIEVKLKNENPGLRHVDIEIN